MSKPLIMSKTGCPYRIPITGVCCFDPGKMEKCHKKVCPKMKKVSGK